MVDAVDAVNLMTVHAAKGLEFPVVFVVNLSRGSGGPRAPIRVAAHAEPEDAVAVGDFESEFDAGEAAREREETKRLMYVALTRARDRLYLVTATTDGAFRPRKGSLGDVLPESIRGVFTSAADASADGADVTWAAESGAAHRFRVCAPATAPVSDPQPPFSVVPVAQAQALEPASLADDFGAVTDSAGRVRTPITRAGAARARRRSSTATGSKADGSVVLGRVVHRLFQAEVRGDLPHDELAAIARGLVSADEAWGTADPGSLASSAARVFSSMWAEPSLRAALDGADCLYEVPVSVLPAAATRGGTARILRGVVDCLACRPDGRVVVVDFKTGARRAAPSTAARPKAAGRPVPQLAGPLRRDDRHRHARQYCVSHVSLV